MTIPLRALLLAAGLGTRLRPLTLHTPKCLVPVAGQPLLERWLKQLDLIGCEAAMINTHYLSEQVETFTTNWVSKTMTIQTVYEPTLLGTAGTLLANRDFFDHSTGLLVHSDNATNADLVGLLKAHRLKSKECLLTMLTFNTSRPSSCGIVETDKKGIVTAFYEKQAKPPVNTSNGAVYVFDSPFIDWIQTLDPNLNDFSTQILPKLVGRIQTWKTSDHFFDIGTYEALEESQTKLESI